MGFLPTIALVAMTASPVQAREQWTPVRLNITEVRPGTATAIERPVSARLREVKALLGYTNAQLAMQFGVSRQTIQNWLSGRPIDRANQTGFAALEDAGYRLTRANALAPLWELDEIDGLGCAFIDIPAHDTRTLSRAVDLLVEHAALIARKRAELDALFGDPA